MPASQEKEHGKLEFETRTREAFAAFFKKYPRLRRSQRNVSLLCEYLRQIGKAYQYEAGLLDEAYRAWESALDLVPLPVAKLPEPPKEEAPTPIPDAFHYRNGIPVIESPQPSPAGDRAELFARANQTAIDNYAEQVRLSGRRH